MKFELEPYRRNVPDETFLEDLRRVAQQLGKNSVTMEEYAEHGVYHSSTVQRRFGSWFVALEKAGLGKARSDLNIPVEKCIADLKQVAERLGKGSVTQREYSKYGQFSPNTLVRRFGSWQAALEENGLKRTRQYRVTAEEYFENLEFLWRTLGRQPHYSEVQKPLSKYSASAYEHKFGSWRKALEAFVEFVNTDAPETNSDQHEEAQLSDTFPAPQSASQSVTSSTGGTRKTTRSISWRLRFLVLRRDSFKCRICGSSPATDPGIVLHVDHIKAWSTGGETLIENLQTLCQRCNIGKSNLSMNPEDGSPASLYNKMQRSPKCT
ncbi:MAG: homing endonuclease associated repeat-containing protein [Thermodesulfobacteriota bacterium]